MINYKKYATVKINSGVDPEGLPIKRLSDVIKQLKDDGYAIKIINCEEK